MGSTLQPDPRHSRAVTFKVEGRASRSRLMVDVACAEKRLAAKAGLA